MRRREVILGGGATVAAAAWPLAPRAQQVERIYRLGFAIPIGRTSPPIRAFFEEMRLLGFVEGQNFVVLPDGFDVANDRLEEQAKRVLASGPDAIVSGPDNYTRAYQQLTRTIPLIGMTEDMVAAGLVSSLSKPGGNTTGISLMSPELDGKRQELLIDAAPNARRITALFDATVTPPAHLQRLQTMATMRRVELSLIGASKREEVLPAISQAKAGGAQALNLLASPLFTVDLASVVARVVELRLPAMHQWPDAAEEGGLIGYGVRFTEVFRQRARMVAKVLRGSSPGEIPIEQPEKFELSINLRTARLIGHEVPVSILLRANQVIE